MNLSEEAPIKHVQCFNRVMYKDVYPNIDLMFIAGEEDAPLAYEFIVNPGGDPSKIKMNYSGAQGINHKGDGTIDVLTKRGYVTEGKPYSYVFGSNKKVASSYHLENNTVSFNLAKYDLSQVIVIDPTLVWATFYGGELDETIFESEIAVDPDGKLISSGSTSSETGIATTGAYDTTYQKLTDIFLIKFTAAGGLSWGTYFGGKGKDGTFGCTLDNDNNIIISGSTSTDSGMATVGAYRTVLADKKGDILLSKFKPNGDIVWSTYYGGTDREHIRTAYALPSNNIMVCGWSSSDTGIATIGAYDVTYGGTGDAFIGKFSKDGKPVWVSYWSGDGDDRCHVIAPDPANLNYVYACGTAESETGFVINSPWQKTRGSLVDAFLGKWDTLGNYYWATYIGGGKDDRSRGVVLDKAGNVYVTGYTQSEDSIATPGSHQDYWGGGYSDAGIPNDDGYLIKFDHDGHYIWGTYYGGDKEEFLRGMVIDNEDNIYVVGDAQSTYNIGTPNGFMPEKQSGTSSDAIFAKWDTNGNLEWGSYLGGSKVDEGDDVVLYQDKFLFVSVESQGDSPVTPNAYQAKNAGGADIVFYKFETGNNCYDPYEPANNSYSKSTPLFKGFNPNTENIWGWNGVISSATDVDYFRFKTNTTSPNYMIILDHLSKDYNLSAITNKGIGIGSSINTGTTPDTVILNNLAKGTYYFQVTHDAATFDSSICYRVRLYKDDTLFGKLTPIINQYQAEEDIIAYPNPAHDHLSLNFIANENEAGEIIIYDMLGRVVYHTNVDLTEGYQQFNVPVSDLINGAYNLVISSHSIELSKAFVKQ